MNLRARQRQVRDLLVAEQLDDAALDPGMAIYRNGYRMRLLEVLRAGFPRTHAWIGDDAFDAAARHYILQRPPSAFTLDDYGCALVATLREADDVRVGEIREIEGGARHLAGQKLAQRTALGQLSSL
jgi:hypothetical protein